MTDGNTGRDFFNAIIYKYIELKYFDEFENWEFKIRYKLEKIN